MESKFIKLLVGEWRDIIESIEVVGYRRKVDSVVIIKVERVIDTFHSEKSEDCYKVVYDFGLSDPNYVEVRPSGWGIKLEEVFRGIMSSDGVRTEDSEYGDILYINTFRNEKSVRDTSDKCDYFVDQGSRFIIQFYPIGFLSEWRDRIIDKILL